MAANIFSCQSACPVEGYLQGTRMTSSRSLRHYFIADLWRGVRIIWPVLTGLICLMALLGLVVAMLEKWPLADGLYFAFVTGLTIGYGDLVPKSPLARVLAVSIGLNGILFTGVIAAVGVTALQGALARARDS
jgi:hypothetical protein